MKFIIFVLRALLLTADRMDTCGTRHAMHTFCITAVTPLFVPVLATYKTYQLCNTTNIPQNIKFSFRLLNDKIFAFSTEAPEKNLVPAVWFQSEQFTFH
jgi:hypothetical protein